jgi:hypothetical protein
MILTEIVSAQTYHPTEHERAVISICAISETPQLADSQINKSYQLVAARDNLGKLGFVNVSQGVTQLTQQGYQVASQQAIMDQQGQPTDNATQLASKYSYRL